MGLFSKSGAAKARQSDETRKLYGFDEPMFRAFAGSSSPPVVEVEITSIERVIVLRNRQTKVHYEVRAVARFGKYSVPCEVQGVEGPLIQFEDIVPPNVVEGWEYAHPRVAAVAHLDGRYIRPDEQDPEYEETVPALNVQLPMKFFRILMRTHLRSSYEHAGFRLRPFGSRNVDNSGLREDWSWQRFSDWAVAQGKSPSSWTILAESVSTWEVRHFRKKP
jgi:hypothetical protein